MKYEWKKVIQNKIIILTVLISCIYTLWFTFSSLSARQSGIQETDTVYQQCLGEYSVEKEQLILQKLGELQKQMSNGTDSGELPGWYLKYSALYSQIEGYHAANTFRETVLKNAARLQKSGDPYIARVNGRIITEFEDVIEDFYILDEPVAIDCAGVQGHLIWADIVNLLVLILAASSIYITEHHSQTYAMVYTSRDGRRRTYFRKLLCVLEFAAILGILTGLCAAFPALLSADAGEWMVKLRMMQTFSASPGDLNLMQYILCVTGMRILGYMVMGAFFVLLAVCFKNIIAPMVLETVLGIGGLWCYGQFAAYADIVMFHGQNQIYKLLRTVTCFGLITDGESFFRQYEPINILNIPCSRLAVCMVLQIFVFFVTAIVGYYVYIHRFRRGGA